MIINLENLDGLPAKYLSELKKYDNIFKESEFLENYENNQNINQLIFEINNYCLENKIIGFHFTNAIENDIRENGMITRSGEQIRNDFVKRFFHLFNSNEQKQIKKKWLERFMENDIESRDNRLFFNFTKNALNNQSAELLLKYYGGEQIYFPLFQLTTVGKKLREIGKPMIIKCTLNPNEIKTYLENPWGKIIISSYNRKLNPEAYVVDQDGYQKKGVDSENIEIINAEKYVC
tara:strand:+ start:4114 stop:4815 length:702 start_codon:yes stop_codon:yes gene_type:complete